MEGITIKASRRTVLKAAGAATVAAALGIGRSSSAFAAKTPPTDKDGWHYSHCRMCMRGDCPNMYRVENGVVVELKGNPLAPNNKGNKTQLKTPINSSKDRDSIGRPKSF